MVTLDGLVHGIAAGVQAVLVIGLQHQAILINDDRNGSAQTGGAGGGAGGGGLQVAGAHMGEVQSLILSHQIAVVLPTGTSLIVIVPAVSGCHGHNGTLAIIIVRCLVILMVVTVEEDNVHLRGNLVNGIKPGFCPGVVITVVVQRLMGGDQQGLGLVQLGCVGLEVGNSLFNSGGKAIGNTVIGAGGIVKASLITVVAAQVTHAQGVDIVIVVVRSAVNAVITGAVGQMALLVQEHLVRGIVVNITVMVRPDKVYIHRGITQAAAALDIANEGIGIAIILGAVRIDRECVATAGDRGIRHAGILKGRHDRLKLILLVVTAVGMQIAEHDRRIHRRLGGCIIRSVGLHEQAAEVAHGQNAQDQHQCQQHAKQTLTKTYFSHMYISSFRPPTR